MENTDLLIIGAGPGGYVAAIRAAQLGMRVIITDKRKEAGGTCLNVGCIPSKSLLNSTKHYMEAKNHYPDMGISFDKISLDVEKMIDNKEKTVSDLTNGIAYLFKKNKITFLNGESSFNKDGSVNIGNDVIKAKHTIIATGSTPRELSNFPVDEKIILSSTGAINMKQSPKNMAVIGGGYIGLELGCVWARTGTNVDVYESLPNIANGMDTDVIKELTKILKKQGLNIHTNANISKAEVKGDKGIVYFEGDKEKSYDAILISVGRTPVTEGLNLENVNVAMDDRGFITVDKNFKTSAENIYAIGDCIGGAMLAHKAEEEGVALVETLTGQSGHVDYDVIPAVIYTHPEVATVGLTEQQVKDKKISYNVGKFPFSANSRARTTGDTDGFVKIIAHKETDQVLGVHIVSEVAGSLIGEAAAIMAFKGSSEDIARICHAHPTHTEAVKEAALATYSNAIHI